MIICELTTTILPLSQCSSPQSANSLTHPILLLTSLIPPVKSSSVLFMISHSVHMHMMHIYYLVRILHRSAHSALSDEAPELPTMLNV